MKRFQFRSRQVSRRGISLLELLIALGLGILLIGSVGATLIIILRTEAAGRQKMERAQLVRALYLRMSDDLRAVTFLEEFVTNKESNEQSAAESADQDDLESELGIEDSEEFLSPSEAIMEKTNGLYGDESSFVIFIHRPARLPARIATGASLSEEDEVIDSVTDSGLRTVSWYLNGSSSIGSLVGESDVPSTLIDNLAFDDSESGGLSRLEQDALEVNFSEDVTDILGIQAELLAPEILMVQFRYYDGADWVSQWDSAIQERLPSAVEVTLTFKEIDAQENRLLFGEESIASEKSTMRFVVALSMAPPPLTEVDL
ncbi:MAG: type II secretion system protein GspJ [Planctomycetaceae bacterium]|jgi:hypothetical protein|nr:type II secretion system protein GspJ [Planctomycetaceae bacterium]MDG2391598.1 type II secretion system protein GspJ [Planctomycetaceae bacterium]